MTPRDAARLAERTAALPAGPGDWFSGYALLGVTFASGHVLAFRRVAASSIGPGYLSVWHRVPDGGWTFYATVPPELACARYFGASVDCNVLVGIEVEWPEPDELRVSVGNTLDWRVRLSSPLMARVYNSIAHFVSDQAHPSPTLLRGMGWFVDAALGTGRVTFLGRTPNRHRFRIIPRRLWLVASSAATWLGQDLGPIAPLPVHASLADLRVPQRGLFVVGREWFDQPARRERKVAALGRPCGPEVTAGCGEQHQADGWPRGGAST
ncbi:MAG: hypothetical protein ABJA98_18405 [Acidobacteriota bacterium]